MPGRAQLLEAAAGVLAGSRQPATTLRHACRKHRVDARRRAPVVRARLHRHVQRRAARTLAGGLERNHLRVRAARALVPALSDNVAVLDDDRTDDGVRMGRAPAALGELERPLEMLVHAVILGLQPSDEEAARAVDVRQREEELGPLRVAKGRPLRPQVVDGRGPRRRRSLRSRRRSSCRRSRRSCRRASLARRRRAAARAGAPAAARRASGDPGAGSARRAPSTVRRRARGRTPRARPAGRARRRRRPARSSLRAWRRSPRARGRGRGASRRRRPRRPAAIALPPGAAQRSSVRSPSREPTASPASAEPRLCGQMRPSFSAAASTRSTRSTPGTSVGSPSTSPRTRRTVVSGGSFCACMSAIACSCPKSRSQISAIQSGYDSLSGPSGSESSSSRRPSERRRSTAFAKGTARSSRARRTSSTLSFTAAWAGTPSR